MAKNGISIYSSTALATKQREIKNIAMKQPVYITENGNGAYVFCSNDVFEDELNRAREEARIEAEMRYVMREGTKDFENGSYFTGVEELRAALVSEKGAK